MLIPPTPEDFNKAWALLQPERLLMVKKSLDHLDDTMRQELSDRLQHTFFPIEWASRLQSILLLLHEARVKDQPGFISKLFLPWIKFRNDLMPARQRVGEEMARIAEMAEGSADEIHHSIALYRTLVSDVLDPYLTLFIACHQFIAGTFVSLESANHSQGEFNKVEFVQSAMRKRGDTADLFRGYNSRVRNAISHAGSHGVTIEDQNVLFRDIKRGSQPVVSTVRWSVDELGWNGILMAELVNSVDAATDIFCLDCIDAENVESAVLLQIIDAAFTQAQRANIRAQLHANIEKVWRDPDINDERRRGILAEILTENCQMRNMPLRGLDLSSTRMVLIAVPPEGEVDDERTLQGRLVELTRYLILAHAVFGPFGELITVAETDEKIEEHRLAASVPNSLLYDYANERAGIIDLLRGGSFVLRRERLEVVFDEKALAEKEDRSLGRAFVRLGRPLPNTPD